MINLTGWVDVGIGLSVIYLGASLFVTILNEYVAQILNLRGKQLFLSLGQLISDGTIKGMLEKSPALRPFFVADRSQTPSYLDPYLFARFLVGGLADGSVTENTKAGVLTTLSRLPDSDLKAQLQALVRSTGSDIESLVKAVGEWADRSLTVLGGRYKQNLQKISLGFGLVVAIGFNINSVTLTRQLYRDKEARESAVALGVQIAEKTDKKSFEKCMSLPTQMRPLDAVCAPVLGLAEAIQARNKSLGILPIGWPSPIMEGSGNSSFIGYLGFWVSTLIGWILTALAISLGAPFWFDLLSKFINLRHGMRKPAVGDA